MRVRAQLGRGEDQERVLHVHSSADLASRLTAASWWNTSRRKRLRLHLAAGIYHQQVHLLDGIDLSGAGEIVWDGHGDTILTHGADSTLSGITVRHTGPAGYAIHADAPCRRSVLRLRGIHAESDSSPALGAGLMDGQRVEAHGSTFTSQAFAAIHLHPWLNQAEPIAAHFTDCHASSPNVGVLWNQLDSGQPDELHWTGRIDAPNPLETTTAPPVLAFHAHV